MSRSSPTPDVVAAIVAAVDAVWPRPVVIGDERTLRVPEQHPPPPWRFSARSWAKRPALGRDRP